MILRREGFRALKEEELKKTNTLLETSRLRKEYDEKQKLSRYGRRMVSISANGEKGAEIGRGTSFPLTEPHCSLMTASGEGSLKKNYPINGQ